MLTSATLTVDGVVRLRARPARRCGTRRELRLDSEFDYARQAILYLPTRHAGSRGRRTSSRRRRGEVIEILEADARAARSCSSRATRTCARSTGSPPPSSTTRSSCRARAPRSALLRDFKATPNAVLLATSSFWQGVDVVGEALSCVIIDKLPFASPGDPITAARDRGDRRAAADRRSASTRSRSRSWRCKQGLGRLLRHRQDRGVLAVLDPRLQTMGYGRRFLASLPPAPVTHDLIDIARFFDRQPMMR